MPPIQIVLYTISTPFKFEEHCNSRPPPRKNTSSRMRTCRILVYHHSRAAASMRNGANRCRACVSRKLRQFANTSVCVSRHDHGRQNLIVPQSLAVWRGLGTVSSIIGQADDSMSDAAATVLLPRSTLQIMMRRVSWEGFC